MTDDIVALDIATVCGWARGGIDSIPRSGSVRFGGANASDNAVFAGALRWLSGFLEPLPRPGMLVIEALLPPTVRTKKGATNRAVHERLAGLHGIARAVGHLRGIFRIELVTVSDARAHFIGDRTLTRNMAKQAVIERCRALGWMEKDEHDDNAGDALALWSYGRALIKPETALFVSPLFNKNLRVHPQ